MKSNTVSPRQRPRIKGTLLGLFPVLALILFGCGTARPSGMLGVEWGDDTAEVVTQLGLNCSTWEPWHVDNRFDRCVGGTLPVFDWTAEGSLFGENDQLVALQLSFNSCTSIYDDLLDAVTLEFETEPGSNYTAWSSGEVVHLEDLRGRCVLTVTDATFGEVFQAYQIRLGLQQLQMRPH